MSYDQVPQVAAPSKQAGWTAFGFLAGIPMLLAGYQVFYGVTLAPYALDPFIVLVSWLFLLIGMVAIHVMGRKDASKLTWQAVGLALLGMFVLLYLNQTHRGVVICGAIGAMLGGISLNVMTQGWWAFEKMLSPLGGVPAAYVNPMRLQELADADAAEREAVAQGIRWEEPDPAFAAAIEQESVVTAGVGDSTSFADATTYSHEPFETTVAANEESALEELESSQPVEPMLVAASPSMTGPMQEPILAEGTTVGDQTVYSTPFEELESIDDVEAEFVAEPQAVEVVGEFEPVSEVTSVVEAPPTELGFDPTAYRFPSKDFDELVEAETRESEKRTTLFAAAPETIHAESLAESFVTKVAGSGSEAIEPIPAPSVANAASQRLLEKFLAMQAAAGEPEVEADAELEPIAPFLRPGGTMDAGVAAASAGNASEGSESAGAADDIESLRDALRRARKY